MALTNYINQVRRLLHDANAQYWSDAELTDDINQARNRIALDTGSLAALLPFYLSQGQEYYPFNGCVSNVTLVAAGSGYTSSPTCVFSGGGGSGVTATASISGGAISGITITANGTAYTAAPTLSFSGGGGSAATATVSILSNVLDIMDITANWQNSWVTLGYAYFSMFQAKARYFRTMTGQPEIWSKGQPPSSTAGGHYFYIFYIPSQSYQAELRCTLTPNSLIDDTTPEQLSYPETDIVQYYAAYLAKYKQQQMDDAMNFLKIYDDLRARGTSNKYQRRIPNPYG